MCENRVQRSVLPGVKTDIAMSLKASYLFILLVYLSTYLVEGSFTICNLFFGFTVICSPIPEMAALTVHSFMFLNAPNWLIWFPKKADTIHKLKFRMRTIIIPNCTLPVVTISRQNETCF